MFIIGLTGSIGMGKSTAAARLQALGINVFDADAEVHRIYDGPILHLIEATFPGTITNGKVDRAKLATALSTNPGGFKTLELMVHPLVRQGARAFLQAEHARGVALAALEFPLLFETRADQSVDATLVVSTDPVTQRNRVLMRPGMTLEKFNTLLARQMPDEEKRRRAHFVVDTSGPVTDTHAQIDQVLTELRGRAGAAYARSWEN